MLENLRPAGADDEEDEVEVEDTTDHDHQHDHEHQHGVEQRSQASQFVLGEEVDDKAATRHVEGSSATRASPTSPTTGKGWREA